MRLRKIKNAKERLQQSSGYYVDRAEEYQGRWSELFGNFAPIHLEIGCGKGKFIVELAEKYPEINFIAMEKYDSVLLRCLQKAISSNLPNLRLVLADACELTKYFAPSEVERIYLNFSDPWPKKSHEKRRLTYVQYLNQYETILKNDGLLIQKTDNRKFFEYSLSSFSQSGWIIQSVCLNLQEEHPSENILTEYEQKWQNAGPIYLLKVQPKRKEI